MAERATLAKIQAVVLKFLQGRSDVALFGAHAVNVYVNEPRATQDVDVLTTSDGRTFAEAVKAAILKEFQIAIRIRKIEGKGFRVYQVAKPKNKHLVDVRPTSLLPQTQIHYGTQVTTPAVLLAQKVIAYRDRSEKPKGFTDRRDILKLLLAFPRFAVKNGTVASLLPATALPTWYKLLDAPIVDDDDNDGY